MRSAHNAHTCMKSAQRYNFFLTYTNFSCILTQKHKKNR